MNDNELIKDTEEQLDKNISNTDSKNSQSLTYDEVINKIRRENYNLK